MSTDPLLELLRRKARYTHQALADLLSLVPGARAHEDLAGFAEWWIRNERGQRGEPEPDQDSQPAPVSGSTH